MRSQFLTKSSHGRHWEMSAPLLICLLLFLLSPMLIPPFILLSASQINKLNENKTALNSSESCLSLHVRGEGIAKATHVLVAVGAGQVERRVAVVILRVGAGLVVQQQQLPKERRHSGDGAG